jgi:hypothetical protein
MRIMEIEKRLHKLENDPKYVEMRENLKSLESSSSGSRYVRIGTPENLNNLIELRKNSKEMDDLIQRYKDNISKYQAKIEELLIEKQKLHKELFANKN